MSRDTVKWTHKINHHINKSWFMEHMPLPASHLMPWGQGLLHTYHTVFFLFLCSSAQNDLFSSSYLAKSSSHFKSHSRQLSRVSGATLDTSTTPYALTPVHCSHNTLSLISDSMCVSLAHYSHRALPKSLPYYQPCLNSRTVPSK